MLGVCDKLGKKSGMDPLIFQIVFVIWFFYNPLALVVYILLSLIV